MCGRFSKSTATSATARQKQKSGLRLDVKAAALKGGDDHAPDIIAGKAKESPLIQMVTSDDKDERMPPKGERLSDAEIATLTAWIDQGAVWPDGVDLVKLADKRDHWSFKPLADPAPPETKDQAWPRNGVDRFILARLEAAGLQPAPEADRVTWLRRVSFDLTGLPPTPEQVADFLEDTRADAHERVVDALLASPRYGERWAQHWLDVVRYADTHGFEVNTERPNAWPYRDYVIRAFNDDTPYDRFIREQIVGDALGEDAATGFLVTASVLLPGQIGKDEPSKRLARQDSLDEIVMNIGQTFLGLSVGCARCHDHKFDPISAARLLRDAGLRRRRGVRRSRAAHAGGRGGARGGEAARSADRRRSISSSRASCRWRSPASSVRLVNAAREHGSLCAGEGEARALHHPRDEQPGAVHRRTRGLRHRRAATSRSPARAPRPRPPATPSSPTATSCGTSTTASTATRAVGCRTRKGKGWVMLEFAAGAR